MTLQHVSIEGDAYGVGVALGRVPDAWPICRKTKVGPDTGYTLATALFEAGADRVTWQVYTDTKAAPLHEGIVRLSAAAA
jgi:hypothetical protein